MCAHTRVCSRAWLTALFNSVEVGWLGPWLANGGSGDFGWGAAIAPSYRFPHEGLPYHPSPERSPFFSHPRDPPPPSPSLPPFSTSLLSHPPSPSFISTQRSVVQHSTKKGRRGGVHRISLSHKRTHTQFPCVCVCVCSICQNSFSSVIGLGVPVSMR